MLAALALTLLAQCSPTGPIYSCPSLMTNYAFFEFAPSNGAGMGTACACVTPTGAKGEVMTFTRASMAWCTKGNETSSIANGDLVECASGKARVMPGGDGTGGNGLNIWEARTNVPLRSTAFDDPAWTPRGGGGGALAVITANYATAPDGTLTAERVQTGACPGVSDYSDVVQGYTATAAAWTSSLYLKGTSGSGTIDLFAFDLTANTGTFVNCAFTSTAWSRCSITRTFANTNVRFQFGCFDFPANVAGVTDVGAQDFLVWQGQAELGSTASPPITTAGTSATRVAELATFPAIASLNAVGSSAASVVVSFTTDAVNHGIITIGNGAHGRPIYIGANSVSMYDGTNVNSIVRTFAVGDTFRAWSSWSGVTMSVNIVGGSSASSAFDGTMTADEVEIGSIQTTSRFNGTIKQVCLDPSVSRCR